MTRRQDDPEAGTTPTFFGGREPVLFWAGCLVAVIGVAAMVAPAVSPVVIGAAAGWVLWLAGVVLFVVALLTRGAGSLFGALAASLIAISSGAYLFFHPSAGAVAVTVLVTAVFIADGAAQLVLALDLRPGRAWRWVLASAVASMLAAVLVAAGLPGQSSLALGVLMGLALITSGLGLMAMGAPPTRRADAATGR